MYQSSQPGRSANCLLAAFSAEDFALLEPDLEPVRLDLRQVLVRPNTPIEHVYFPESGMSSNVAEMPRDRRIEVGIIGREGLCGAEIVMTADRSPNETFVQVAGGGLRIRTDRVRHAMAQSASLQGLLLRYFLSLQIQISQTALANGRSKIEERLARWILMAQDRQDGNEICLTHDFLALMLGVRRPGVTVALHVLEGQGLIRSVRGRILVIDREGLEEAADGAYGVPEAEYRRLMS